MSRAYRKLMRERESSHPVAQPVSDAESEEMLSGGDEGTGDDLDQEDSEPEHEVEDEPEVAQARPPVKSAKKKKKKKGKNAATSLAKASAEKSSGRKGSADLYDNLDEIDRTLKELNEKFGELPAASPEIKVAQAAKSLLAVDPRALDADAEMRKMFGSRVVNDEIRRKKYIRSGKRTALAVPREHWPKAEKLGLTMDLLDTRNGILDFAFVHSRSYQDIQQGFLECVATHDPNTIQQLLHLYPYHIDSLLQLSEIAKHSGDITLAAELVERALFAFERCFHSQFNITIGICRLSYRRFENRSFHLAVFRHMGYLGRRGCWRTAFEFAKLLLSLDPEDDPIFTLGIIDFYAINAKEVEWYSRFWDAYCEQWKLASKPNHAFSIALATWELETGKNQDHAKSSSRLQQAIIDFPSMINCLYDKVGTSSAGVSADSGFFSGVNAPPYLNLAIQLYVERNHTLWKVPEVLAWLRENVSVVATRHSGKDANSCSPSKQIRSEFQKDIPRNLSRHIFISDFASITSALPPDVTAAGIQAHDPIPPENGFPSPYHEFEQQQSAAARDPSGFLSNMLQQLLPWMNRPGGEGLIDDDDADIADNAEGDIRDLADLADGVLNPPNDLIDGERDEQVAATLRAMQESLPGLFPATASADGTSNQDFMSGLRDTFSRLGLFGPWGGANNEAASDDMAPPMIESDNEAGGGDAGGREE
ncbi:transcriptional repressor TCF25-domain-containing protein [Powellomyces hirtus]|nr:transcriptional repressor TCF25-domain-containing protein [Powellomyces hirtus]